MHLALREPVLRRRPVSRLRLLRRRCARRVRARTPLRRLAEDLVAQQGELLRLPDQRELELRRRLLGLELGELTGELLGLLSEVLALERRQLGVLP
jgi:hypothetical protein